MYQIARPERDIFAQLFLELSDIISSHHYDALIHKSFISWWLRFLKFHILARFLFFSLIDGRAGPPRILTRAPPPSSPFCLVSQIYFGRFFREPRWSHPTRPVGPKSKGVPCFRSKWGVFTIFCIFYIFCIFCIFYKFCIFCASIGSCYNLSPALTAVISCCQLWLL